MAVVAIFGLMAALIVPNLDLLHARKLRSAAEQIADRLELARQRTVVTGKAHRLHIDLDASSYRLEWFGSEKKPVEVEPEPQLEDWQTGSARNLSLAPPRGEAATFHPIEGLFGIGRLLDPGIIFARVETDQGDTTQGWTGIEFAKDGTTDGATIVLENERGDALFIEIAPLADVVQVYDAES